jgi:aldehyde dehydrogenase (NAD+)
LIDRMPSGGAVIVHIAAGLAPQLPFGGGLQRMGAYHGKWGFEASATGGPCWRSRTSRTRA